MRQAGEIARLANTFKSGIRICKIGGKHIDAKSVLSVMSLAAAYESRILVSAEGEDAQAAVDALAEMIQLPQES